MKFKKSILVLVSLINLALVACKKEFNGQQKEGLISSANSTSSGCKATGLGKATIENGGTVSWKNVLLKWYDQTGRLKNVKLFIEFYAAQPTPEFTVDYGELTYSNNELRLRDVYYNEEVLSVKLDAMGRPIVSYFNNYGRGNYPFQWDTTYYFYSSSNRLDSILMYRQQPGPIYPAKDTWHFTYDSFGNLVLIADTYGVTYEFIYDYTQFNKGMVGIHYLTTPLKILEYLDLITFEHKHQLRYVIWNDWDGLPIFGWVYENIQKDPDGKVISYNSPFAQYTFYTAWDCGGTHMIQNNNPTQEEFMKMFNH